tara:strand:+ start:334 stop:732 length:399 start_codon:yes stop_codon:yes gene_type:complete
MTNSRRVEKFAALIRREISDLLSNGIQHQMLQNTIISITQVDVSGDLQHCKIFVSLFGDEKQKSEVLNGLEASSGFLKGELARRLKMRRTPEIVFKLDRAMEKGTSVLNLLGKLENERKVKKNISTDDFEDL